MGASFSINDHSAPRMLRALRAISIVRDGRSRAPRASNTRRRKLRRRARKPSLSDAPEGGLGRGRGFADGYPCQGGPHSSGVHMDTPVRPAQGALGVRSTLHLGVAVAADCVRAVPPVRRRTRVRIPRWPRRAERMHTHRAILACPQRVGRRSGHPSVGKALGWSSNAAPGDKTSSNLIGLCQGRSQLSVPCASARTAGSRVWPAPSVSQCEDSLFCSAR